MPYVDDLDPVELSTITEPRARKEHRCSECRGAILPGTQYVRIESLMDGAWWTFKTCPFCVAASRYFTRRAGETWALGDLLSNLRDEWYDAGASMPLGRLIAHMRRKWRGVSVDDVRALAETAA